MANDSTITTERSAGVIVYREDLFGAREYLLLDYGRHWDFPKGHVEENESDRAAANRELLEETGIHHAGFREEFCREIVYFFRARNRVVRKTVVFFVAHVESGRVRMSREHKGFVWLTFDDAINRLTYASTRDVLKFADVFLAGDC